MSPDLNLTSVRSRRRLGRLLDIVIEVAKLAITFAVVIAMLAFAVFRFTGVNPFAR